MMRRDDIVRVDRPTMLTIRHFFSAHPHVSELFCLCECLSRMRTLTAALAYAIVATAMACGFVAAATWLVAPDASAPLVARAAPPIPPRIAESIERRMAWVPEQPRDPPPTPVSTKPALQEASVSLVARPPVEVSVRNTMAAPAPIGLRQKPRSQQANTATASALEASRVTMPIAAARSDIPY
jgi:hypothetical protein